MVDVVGTVIFLVTLIVFFFVFKFIRKESHNISEGRIISKAGKDYKKILAELDSVKKGQKKSELKKEISAEKAEKDIEESGSKDKGESVKKMSKLEFIESKLEEETTEVVEKSLAFIADLQEVTDEILDSVNEKIKQEKVEEYEIAKIEALYRQLKKVDNFSQMDEKTAEYFSKYFESFDKQLEEQIAYEEQSEEHHLELVKGIKKSMRHGVSILNDAKIHLRKIKSLSGKSRKRFNSELKTLKRLIKQKYKELRREIRKGKKADGGVIVQLNKELILLENNAVSLKKLDKGLEDTYKFMDKEIVKLQKILRQIIRTERSQKKYSKTTVKREKQISKRLDELLEVQKEISTDIKKFEGAGNIYGLVLSFSTNVSKYFDKYKEMLKEDISFENKLKELIAQNIVIEKKMLAFLTLIGSLNSSEQAVESGIEQVVQIISSIYTQEVAADLENSKTQIENDLAIIDYEKKVEEKMKALIQEIEQKTLLASKKVEDLIKKEEKVILENEALRNRESTHLGKSMATLVNKKVAVGDQYLSQSDKFSEQLEKRNAIAQASYKQALKAA